MISIIISSVDQMALARVKANIDQTIGVAYEIIAIENAKGERGICEVYNLGMKQSKYDLVCFMHEDVEIHTLKWGEIVGAIFAANPRLGLIGVAGSQYKSLTPSGWHCYGIDAPQIQYYHIIQQYKFSAKEEDLAYSNPENVNLAKVVCIDGVWFCMSREAALFYPFDEQLLKGFHGYDLDLALGINQRYDVAVTFEVLLTHFSEGNFNAKWLREILKVHAKWSKYLPINLARLPHNKIFNEEKRAFRNIIERMWVEQFELREMFNIVWDSRKSKLMSFGLSLKLYWQVVKYVLKSRPSS